MLTSEEFLIKSIDNVIINHTNIVEETSSPLDVSLKLPYLGYINFGYENEKINLNKAFGRNKEMGENYFWSFEPAVNYVLKEIKTSTVSIEMEEIGWTIPIYDHHVTVVGCKAYTFNFVPAEKTSRVRLHKLTQFFKCLYCVRFSIQFRIR